jgi:hypothetical protein
MTTPPNVSEADFVKWNEQREELYREIMELRYKVEVLSARLYLNGIPFEVDMAGVANQV